VTVIHAPDTHLGPQTRPEWCQTPSAGFFRMSNEGGEHDCHYHEYNELYLISRGMAKIMNAGRHQYVREGDIVCIRAGDEHDILEATGTMISSCSGFTSPVRMERASDTCIEALTRRSLTRSRRNPSRPTFPAESTELSGSLK
jgi:uncharacterized protein YjlB